MILDIFSRYVVGWILAHCETAQLSTRLMNESIMKQGIVKGELTIHSDRGSAMIAKPVVHLLADLGVTKSHSRPHVSNGCAPSYQGFYPSRGEANSRKRGSMTSYPTDRTGEACVQRIQ